MSNGWLGGHIIGISCLYRHLYIVVPYLLFTLGSHMTLVFCLKLVSCLLSPSDEPLSVSIWTLKNPHSIPYQPELKTLKKEIHPSIHNHLLPVTHHFLNKWKVSLKTYEHLLYLSNKCLSFFFNVKARETCPFANKKKCILLNVDL